MKHVSGVRAGVAASASRKAAAATANIRPRTRQLRQPEEHLHELVHEGDQHGGDTPPLDVSSRAPELVQGPDAWSWREGFTQDSYLRSSNPALGKGRQGWARPREEGGLAQPGAIDRTWDNRGSSKHVPSAASTSVSHALPAAASYLQDRSSGRSRTPSGAGWAPPGQAPPNGRPQRIQPARPLDPPQITKAISSASSWQHLFQVCSTHQGSFNSIHAAAALVRLAKVSTQPSPTGPPQRSQAQPLTKNPSRSKPPTLADCVALIASLSLEHAPSFNARALANSLWAAAKLACSTPAGHALTQGSQLESEGDPPPDLGFTILSLVLTLTRMIPNHAARLEPQHISNSVYALATVIRHYEAVQTPESHPSAGCTDTMQGGPIPATPLSSKVSELVLLAEDIMPILMAASHPMLLGEAHPGFDSPVRQGVPAQQQGGPSLAAGFEPQGLSNVLYAVALFGLQPTAEWMSDAVDAVVPMVHLFEPQHTSSMLWALAHIGYNPAIPKLPLFTGQGLSNMLWALARLEHPSHPTLMAPLLAEIIVRSRVGELNGQDVSNSLWALAEMERLNLSGGSNLLAHGMLPMLDDLTPQQLSNSMWGLSVLGFLPVGGGRSWAEAGGSSPEGGGSRWGAAGGGPRTGEIGGGWPEAGHGVAWACRCLAACARLSHQFKPQELSNVALACVRMGLVVAPKPKHRPVSLKQAASSLVRQSARGSKTRAPGSKFIPSSVGTGGASKLGTRPSLFSSSQGPPAPVQDSTLVHHTNAWWSSFLAASFPLLPQAFEPQHVANSMWATAHCGCSPPVEWTTAILDRVLAELYPQGVPKLAVLEELVWGTLVSVLWASARMRTRVGATRLLALAVATGKLTKYFNQQGLGISMWALASLGFSLKPIQEVADSLAPSLAPNQEVTASLAPNLTPAAPQRTVAPLRPDMVSLFLQPGNLESSSRQALSAGVWALAQMGVVLSSQELALLIKTTEGHVPYTRGFSLAYLLHALARLGFNAEGSDLLEQVDERVMELVEVGRLQAKEVQALVYAYKQLVVGLVHKRQELIALRTSVLGMYLQGRALGPWGSVGPWLQPRLPNARARTCQLGAQYQGSVQTNTDVRCVFFVNLWHLNAHFISSSFLLICLSGNGEQSSCVVKGLLNSSSIPGCSHQRVPSGSRERISRCHQALSHPASQLPPTSAFEPPLPACQATKLSLIQPASCHQHQPSNHLSPPVKPPSSLSSSQPAATNISL
eukprot:gene4581-14762_t